MSIKDIFCFLVLVICIMFFLVFKLITVFDCTSDIEKRKSDIEPPIFPTYFSE